MQKTHDPARNFLQVNAAAAPATLGPALQTLGLILSQLVEQHTQLLDLLHRQRVALREHRPDTMRDLCTLENQLVQRITALEKERLERVAMITLLLNPQAEEPLRMGDLAERLPEPLRGQLLVQRRQLLEAMQQVQAQTQVARQATEQLLRHMDGVIRSAASAASAGVRTYSRRGRVTDPAAPISTFAMTA